MTKITMNSNALITHLLAAHQLKNDATLGRSLKLAAPVISKLRHGHMNVSDNIMLRIHEVFNMSFADIRRVLGVAPPAYLEVPNG